MRGMRAISAKTVPIYAWLSGGVSSIMRAYGPEELGGNGDLAEKIRRINADSEEGRAEEMRKVSVLSRQLSSPMFL